MADPDQVKIDKDVFHDRLSAFQAQWKNDKRSGDTLFAGVGSIVIILGKNDESLGFQKNNSFQVCLSDARYTIIHADDLQFWLLGYEFPATLLLLTPETCYIVTTKKKGTDHQVLKIGQLLLTWTFPSILSRASERRQGTSGDSTTRQGQQRECQNLRAMS